MKNPLKVTKDFTKNFNEIISKFKNDKVLIGVPENKADRKDDEINNATLLAIMNFGSPSNNIPPWPILDIGIEKSKEEVSKQFALAAEKALSDGPQAVDRYYERAGIIASNSVKLVLNSQINAPEGRPLESTIKARKRKGFKGKKYWLVTGQLRNSITYVVKK